MTTHERPFEVDPSEYPFESHWFERDGNVMHYLDEGAGVPILLLHSNMTWSFLYRQIILQLRDECRLIAPDYIGFGMSDNSERFSYVPSAHAEYISALIDYLQLDYFVLVAIEWGGPIGLSVAVNRPVAINGIVLCNTWCWKAGYPVWRVFSKIFGSPLGKYLVKQRNIMAERLMPTGFSNPDLRTEATLDAYRKPFPTPSSRQGMYVFPRELMNSGDWKASIESKLHKLADKPIEIVVGHEDPFFAKKEILERWSAIFPDAQIDVVENAGHYIQEEAPDRVVAAIRRILLAS